MIEKSIHLPSISLFMDKVRLWC